MVTTHANRERSVATPTLNIPTSSSTVSIKIIDVSTIANVPMHALVTPLVHGIEVAEDCPSYSFLIEHPSGQKVLFDLGIRKDWQNLAPAIVERFKKVGHRPMAEKNVSEVLDESGVGKDNIQAVIWSHSHWDHVGDMSTFGPGVDLVVGPGFTNYFLKDESGNSALGGVLPSDVEGRKVREIDFNEAANVTKIGKFPAYDYFGDGSLYLLDTPGHCVAHLCALVRTTTSPDTFVFLAGDAAHHCGEIRPSAYSPFPESMPLSDAKGHTVPVCPGSWYEDLQLSRNRDPKGPLWQPSFGHDMEQTMATIGHVQEYDGDENVFIILAHDPSLRAPDVPFFPTPVNDWKQRGLSQKYKWAWVASIMAGMKGQKSTDYLSR